jgi:hypothetical protein
MSNVNIGKYIRKNKTWNVGTLGEGKYVSRINSIRTKEYIAWDAMLQRCYDPKLHKRHPSYKDCIVCEEWLNFQNFAEWFNNNYIEGCQLDKDLLVKDNKLYSPETCCFVPQEVNLSLIKPMNKRIYPLGVYKHHNKFVAHVKENKISKYKGIFSTITEAANCYKEEKEKQLIQLAIKYTDVLSKDAYTALINYKI